EERSLLAGFVGAGAPVHIDVAVEAGTEDVPAEEAVPIRLVYSALENGLYVQEFATYIDVGDLGADGVAADRAPFDQKVRVALHQRVIFERAGLALIGVAGDVARGNFLVDELPLHPGRKAGTATPTEARRLDHLDDLVGLLRQRLFQRVVAFVPEIEVQRE